MSKVWFRTKDNYYITDNDIARAYTISTGNNRYTNPFGYFSFLESIWGKYVLEAVCPTVDMFLQSDQKIAAIKLYKEQNKCSLVDAKAAIDSMVA